MSYYSCSAAQISDPRANRPPYRPLNTHRIYDHATPPTTDKRCTHPVHECRVYTQCMHRLAATYRRLNHAKRIIQVRLEDYLYFTVTVVAPRLKMRALLAGLCPHGMEWDRDECDGDDSRSRNRFACPPPLCVRSLFPPPPCRRTARRIRRGRFKCFRT